MEHNIRSLEEEIKMIKFFEAGKSYNCYLLSGAVRTFTCTMVDESKMMVRGSYEGGKEKSYRVEPRWSRMIDKQEGLPPSTYAIEVAKRNGTVCIAKDEK